MEGVRSTDHASRDRQLDSSVPRQGEHAACGQKRLSRHVATENLEQDGNAGREERGAVHGELAGAEVLSTKASTVMVKGSMSSNNVRSQD